MAGTGEHFQDLEPFEPKGFVRRLLNMGDVDGWVKFVTETPDMKPKWVNDKEVGPDPDYVGCPADADAETSAPARDDKDDE